MQSHFESFKVLMRWLAQSTQGPIISPKPIAGIQAHFIC
jgi:hypothetical protein